MAWPACASTARSTGPAWAADRTSRSRPGRGHQHEPSPTGIGDTITNAGEDLTGKGKQAAGDATGDELEADAEKAGANVKDVFEK